MRYIPKEASAPPEHSQQQGAGSRAGTRGTSRLHSHQQAHLEGDDLDFPPLSLDPYAASSSSSSSSTFSSASMARLSSQHRDGAAAVASSSSSSSSSSRSYAAASASGYHGHGHHGASSGASAHPSAYSMQRDRERERQRELDQEREREHAFIERERQRERELERERERQRESRERPRGGDGEWQQAGARRSGRSHHAAASSASAGAAPTHQSGYNSDDEHGGSRSSQRRDLGYILRETKGWNIVPMGVDGACLFRSIAYHLFGDQELHGDVRKQCMDYMERNRDHFAQFVTEDFGAYIARKRESGCYGNHLEIQAMSELYNRNIEVYVDSPEPINTFLAQGSTEPPIRVSYHNNIHYNAIVDPNLSTFGVGLGFSDIRPGEPDRQQMEAALRESEREVLERELLRQLEDESDWQRTQAEIEAAIIAESQAEYYRSLAKRTEPE